MIALRLMDLRDVRFADGRLQLRGGWHWARDFDEYGRPIGEIIAEPNEETLSYFLRLQGQAITWP